MKARNSAAHRRRLAVTLAFVAALLNAGCVLGDGMSCNNADVKASIAEDALISIGDTIKRPPNAEDLKLALRDYSLHDTFELSRAGDVVSCRGTLGMRKGKPGFSDFPLDYEVTKSNDGNVLYTFDKVRFGPAAIALMALQGMAESAKQHKRNGAAETSTLDAAPTPSSSRHLPKFADPRWTR